MYTDKITRESILLRALSNIKRNGENQSDTGVTRLYGSKKEDSP